MVFRSVVVVGKERQFKRQRETHPLTNCNLCPGISLEDVTWRRNAREIPEYRGYSGYSVVAGVATLAVDRLSLCPWARWMELNMPDIFRALNFVARKCSSWRNDRAWCFPYIIRLLRGMDIFFSSRNYFTPINPSISSNFYVYRNSTLFAII